MGASGKAATASDRLIFTGVQWKAAGFGFVLMVDADSKPSLFPGSFFLRRLTLNEIICGGDGHDTRDATLLDPGRSIMAVDFLSWIEGVRTPGAVLIVLNQPIEHVHIFDKAWEACEYHVVTDGAANHMKSVSQHTKKKYTPDFIVGDFDSIDAEVREWYVRRGVPFVTDESVYATDFMKAMEQSHTRFDGAHKTFIAFGALGGRVDHTWHSYFCLSVAERRGDRLILASNQSVTLLVPPGRHSFATPPKLVGETCGYAPLEGFATVATGGFEWDVEDYYVSFTTRLSTSNLLRAAEVWLQTDKPLMFTVEIRKTLQN